MVNEFDRQNAVINQLAKTYWGSNYSKQSNHLWTIKLRHKFEDEEDLMTKNNIKLIGLENITFHYITEWEPTH